jgi:hypothetical protein
VKVKRRDGGREMVWGEKRPLIPRGRPQNNRSERKGVIGAVVTNEVKMGVKSRE